MGPGADCPNQYWNGGPLPSKIAQLLGEWTGVALSNYGTWSDDSDDPALNTSGINLRYAGVEGSTHFVIDTSRNGLGPWAPPAGAYPDAQDWCNPPDRGAGLRPTLNTGVALLDAFLWVKIPGESDGECTRGLGPTGTEDPEWGQVDPAAGQWFPASRPLTRGEGRFGWARERAFTRERASTRERPRSPAESEWFWSSGTMFGSFRMTRTITNRPLRDRRPPRRGELRASARPRPCS